MKVLFTTFPAYGHFHPLVPLAKALEGAGHEVAFACPPGFAATIKASGFRVYPAGLDWPEGGWGELFPEVRSMTSVFERNAWSLRHIWIDTLAQHMVPDLLDLTRSWMPDVIVRDPPEFGGCIAAECLGIPHATGREGPFRSPTSWQQLAGKPLNDLRHAHGLPPDPELEMLYRYLGLVWAPCSYLDSQDFIYPTMHFLQQPLFDRSGDETLPEWIGDLPRQPTVYATLGTVFQAPAIFRAIIDGLRDEAINLIVTVGHNQDPAQFGRQPANVHIERYIPQTLIFPYCDLVITHGGFGTVMAALSHGLPMVVVPISADQPRNAERCGALGVAAIVAPDRRTTQAIREATMNVLEDPIYKRSAEWMCKEIEALPGLEYGVKLLERLAVERRPLTSQIL